MERENINVTNNKVILNLIQDLQRKLGSLRNCVRGRFQIKFGMTPLWNRMGFTLIELLVVVLIIGILAAIALPQYQFAVAKSRLASMRALLASIKVAEEVHYLEQGGYTNDWGKLSVNLNMCVPTFVDSDLRQCGDFILDPLTGDGNEIVAHYCPNFKTDSTPWGNCISIEDYEYHVWFNHSEKPNQIECVGKTTLGQKICKAYTD